MKRLLAAGFEKIFQITRAFRADERGRLHHPEFTILEWYRSGADYKALQQDCQNLVQSACLAAAPEGGPGFRGAALDPHASWGTYTVKEAFVKFAGWDPGPDPPKDRFDIDMVQKVEPNLGFPAPCILEDYPRSQASLARIKPGEPEVAERFELYWAGIELANGFSELTCREEQKSRFVDAISQKERMESTLYPMPEAFLSALHHLGPCAGIALGVDRLIMLIAGCESIDSVVAFPPEIA
jgi:lysyl-tRNA synthetase class 2